MYQQPYDSTSSDQDANAYYTNVDLEQARRLLRWKDEQIAQRDMKISQLEGLREKDSRERLAEREFLKRHDAKPDYKLFVAQVMWRLGVGFGNFNENRWDEFTEIKLKDIAADVGISRGTAGEYMAFLNKQTENNPKPMLKREDVRKPRRVEVDGQWVDTGKFYKQGTYAPRDPHIINDILDKPDHIPLPTKIDMPRRTKGATHKKAKDAEVKRILAQCPGCGSTNVGIVCRDCGQLTPVEEMPSIPHGASPRQTAPVEDDDPDEEEWTEGDDTVCADSAHTVDMCQDTPTGYGTVCADSAHVLGNGSNQEEEVSTSSTVCAESAHRYATVFANTASDAPPPEEMPDMDAELKAITLPLVGNDHDLACVLGMATQVLMAITAGTTSYTVMQSRRTEKDHKYLTTSALPSAEVIAGHLVGNQSIGASLLLDIPHAETPMARAVAYDHDQEFHKLVTAAQKLQAHGLNPLLVRNDAKKASGHLWLLFDAAVPVERTFAILEEWAPELQLCPEKFPNLKIKGGGKLRLPGGMYHPVGLQPIPVQVALVGDDGAEWFDALSPEAWDAIRSCVTPASCLDHAWIKPDARPRPKPKAALQPPTVRRATSAGDTVQDAVDRFNRDRGIRDQVRDINRAGMFSSPFHEDTNPSCKLYEDGHWCDFSAKERHHFDALDYYCAQQRLWTDQERRTDAQVRVKVLRDLNYLPAAEKRPDVLSVRLEQVPDAGERTVVRIVAADRAKWEAARASFKAACQGAWFNGVEKHWELPPERYQEAKAWQLAYVSGRGAQ